jgi:hypothetical protein
MKQRLFAETLVDIPGAASAGVPTGAASVRGAPQDRLAQLARALARGAVLDLRQASGAEAGTPTDPAEAIT